MNLKYLHIFKTLAYFLETFENVWKLVQWKIFEVEENWIFENIEETFENIKKDIEDIWKYWKIYSKTLENIE